MATSTSTVHSAVRAILRSTLASASTAKGGGAGATLHTEGSLPLTSFEQFWDRVHKPSSVTMPSVTCDRTRAMHGGVQAGKTMQLMREYYGRRVSSGPKNPSRLTLEMHSMDPLSGTCSNAVSSPPTSLDSLMRLVCELQGMDTTTVDYSSLILFPRALSSSQDVQYAMPRSAIKQCLMTEHAWIPKRFASTTTRSKTPEASSSAKDNSTP
jgi:hypothetical protein